MSILNFQQGSVVDLVALFTSDGTTPVNPTTVSLVIQLPDKTVISLNPGDPLILNPLTGTFKYVLALSQRGNYYWRFSGQSGSAYGIVLAGQLISKRDPQF